MLNPFAIEKEIFAKLDKFQYFIRSIQAEVSTILINKSHSLEIPLSEDLREKCAAFILDPNSSKKYQCKVCGKHFDDGRKLGGHVSRAHKDDPDKNHKQIQWKQTESFSEDSVSSIHGKLTKNVKRKLIAKIKPKKKSLTHVKVEDFYQENDE